MKENKYTADQLLNVLASYQRLIERNGKEYAVVTLDDIAHSIKSVLEANDYQGKKG